MNSELIAGLGVHGKGDKAHPEDLAKTMIYSKLNHRISELSEKLNSFRLVARLPSEILLQIVQLVIGGDEDSDEVPQTLTRLSLVCKGWNSFVASNSALWCRIIPGRYGNLHYVNTALQRSSSRPLSVFFDSQISLNIDCTVFMQMICKVVGRWKWIQLNLRVNDRYYVIPGPPSETLEFFSCTFGYQFEGELSLLGGFFPSSLKTLSLQGCRFTLISDRLKHLETLRIEKIPSSSCLSVSRFLEILPQLGCLKTLHFLDGGFVDYAFVRQTSRQQVLLPTIRELLIYDDPQFVWAVISSICLPNCRSLSIVTYDSEQSRWQVGSVISMLDWHKHTIASIIEAVEEIDILWTCSGICITAQNQAEGLQKSLFKLDLDSRATPLRVWTESLLWVSQLHQQTTSHLPIIFYVESLPLDPQTCGALLEISGTTELHVDWAGSHGAFLWNELSRVNPVPDADGRHRFFLPKLRVLKGPMPPFDILAMLSRRHCGIGHSFGIDVEPPASMQRLRLCLPPGLYHKLEEAMQGGEVDLEEE